MNIKKKYFKAIAGLGAGAVLLTCAVFANYDNANSYTNCKNALKSLLYADNMSIDYTAELKVDDQKVGAYYGGWKMNINGDPTYRYENTHEFGDNMYYDLNQLQGDIEINKVVTSNGGTHAYYYNNGGYKPGTAIEQISGGEGSDFGDNGRRCSCRGFKEQLYNDREQGRSIKVFGEPYQRPDAGICQFGCVAYSVGDNLEYEHRQCFDRGRNRPRNARNACDFRLGRAVCQEC